MNHASCSITSFKMRDARLEEGHCFRENTPGGLWRGPACIPTWFSKAASSLTILAMVADRTGVSVVREMAVEKRDGCRFLPLADESATRRVGIVQLKQHFRSHVHQAFLEHLRPRIPPLANPA
jgi:DNA-binding transcriptional LysR family regulator